MIHFRTDGDTLYNGLNIYKFYKSTAWGFVFRYGPRNAHNLGKKIFIVRYDRISRLFNLATLGVD